MGVGLRPYASVGEGTEGPRSGGRFGGRHASVPAPRRHRDRSRGQPGPAGGVRRRHRWQGKRERDVATVRLRHVGVVRGHDVHQERPAGRQPRHRWHAQCPDVDHQHRRLHVERRRRGEPRHHRPRRAGQPAEQDTHHARAHGAAPGKRAVLQLVRRPHGAKLTVWPPTGQPLTPILSSVDNGWLATGLRIVRGAVPRWRPARARSTTA